MLKIKVIADNIMNLTDARYFAAFGVDHLVFNVTHIAPALIQEIKDWIEGASILLDINKELTPQLLENILKISPTGFVSNNLDLLVELNKQLPETIMFFREEEVKLFSVCEGKKNQLPFIKVGSSPELEALLTSEKMTGIIVEGKPEEKVGFKNFDQLDEIFELIEVQ